MRAFLVLNALLALVLLLATAAAANPTSSPGAGELGDTCPAHEATH